MKIKYNYGNKSFNISPYTTEQEKAFLLLSSLEANSLDAGLNILDIEEELSKEEKIALLYKFRSISVGDVLPMSYTCKHCQQVNEIELELGEIVTEKELTDDRLKNAYKILTDENFQDFCNVQVDDLELDEYDELFEKAKNEIIQFNFIKTHNCLQCKGDNNFDISGDEEQVIENMSDDSLMSLYQAYSDLNFFGNYSKIDIDSMYPFERTIFIGLLNKTREDMNK